MTYQYFRDKLGNPISIYQLEYNNVADLFNENQEESLFLECKACYDIIVKKEHIPKTITAFANSYGGWLIIGIMKNDDNDNSLSTNFKIVDVDCEDDIPKEIQIILNTSTDPPPSFEARFLNNPNDKGRGLIVIFVPEGKNPPYIFKGKIFQRLIGQTKEIKANQKNKESEYKDNNNSPIHHIYDLDKLYEKRNRYEVYKKKFCKKDMNLFFGEFSSTLDESKHPHLNIYFIPEGNINRETSEYVTHILNNLDNITNSKLANELAYNRFSSMDIQFTDQSIVAYSIPVDIYELTYYNEHYKIGDILDTIKSRIACSFEFDGNAKMFIPLKIDSYADLKHGFFSTMNYEQFKNNKFIDADFLIGYIIHQIESYVFLNRDQYDIQKVYMYIELTNSFQLQLYHNKELSLPDHGSTISKRIIKDYSYTEFVCYMDEKHIVDKALRFISNTFGYNSDYLENFYQYKGKK